MDKQYLIGIDLGTTKAKTGLFDVDGSLLRLVYGSYSIFDQDGPGCAEQNPEDWWKVICQSLREVLQDIDNSEVAAICIGGQGPTTVMVDAEGNHLCNAILWMDTRTKKERDFLSNQLGIQVSPYSYIPQAMRLKNHHPEAYKKARWFLSAWDFIALRLSGRAFGSYFGGEYPFPQEEMVMGLLNPEFAPPKIAMGEPIGKVTRTASKETGLPVGVLVVAGINDGMETFIGSALTEVGRAVDIGGTSGGFRLCWKDDLVGPGIYSQKGILPDQFIVGGSMNALGKSIDWYLNTFGDESTTYESLFKRIAAVPAGAERLIFLPYLAGERAPIMNLTARGVFFGLSLNHTRDHLARAVIEASAYAVCHLAEHVQLAGGKIREMRICGQQAQSDILSQIKADVLGVQVAIPQVAEAAVMGAGVLAGLGAGFFTNIASSVEKMVRIRKILQPDPNLRERYSQTYNVYRRLHSDLRESFEQLQGID